VKFASTPGHPVSGPIETIPIVAILTYLLLPDAPVDYGVSNLPEPDHGWVALGAEVADKMVAARVIHTIPSEANPKETIVGSEISEDDFFMVRNATITIECVKLTTFCRLWCLVIPQVGIDYLFQRFRLLRLHSHLPLHPLCLQIYLQTQ
jgi:hypothetical protein